MHVTVGSAGASVEKGGFSPSLGNFSAAHVNDYGYLRLEANATVLHGEFVRVNPHDNLPAGQVWDQFNLFRW